MTASALSEQQGDAIRKVLVVLARECEARAIAICDIGGNTIAQHSESDDLPIETASALASGAFAATRELADTIGEPGFRSICHRGQNSGILIRALGSDFLIMVILGKTSIEGLVRLHVKKTARQLESILAETVGQTAQEAGAGKFEIEEKPGSEVVEA
ncbi:MAG: hypothetical protein E4H02_11435 [Lentisphaerales bacterium]|jgi:predicted regulator of Ras-like GTPase activity (Roadblock/LC7/MglB family)|nr:MAG: hypothetical protein E4H02_11435 [Lentisphaerales bacterium]